MVGESEKGDGVFGRSLSKSGVGVHGSALADDGKALGDGIKGEGIRGVYGIGRMGVEGESENDYGVVGESKIGYGAEFIGGRAQLLLKPNIGDKPPGSDLNKHKTGEIYVYQSNEHSDA